MSQLEKYPGSIMQDDRLADFTDQTFTGIDRPVELDADEELMTLEQTILRLKKAFPPITLEQSAVKQMQVRFNARVRRKTQEVKQPFWKKWFEPQARLQFGMTFAAMALALIFIFSAPLMTTTGSTTSATALTPTGNIFIILALAGIVIIFLWIKPRK